MKEPTKEEIAKQVKEYGDTLGFTVKKKCNNCKLCKCKKDEKKEQED